MTNNATSRPRRGRGSASPASDDVDDLQHQVDRLEDLLAGIEALAARRTRRSTPEAVVSFKAWIDANFDAIHGVPRSEDDDRYSALLDEIEAACPETRTLVHELDSVVGSRLCQHMDHVAALAWELLRGAKP